MATYQYTGKQIADKLGVTKAMVYRYAKEGRFEGCYEIRNGRKYYDLAKTRKAYKKNSCENHRKKRIKGEVVEEKPITIKTMKNTIKLAGIDPNLTWTESRNITEQYKAALLKLDYEAKEKTLLLAADVERQVKNDNRLTRDALLNIPDRVSDILSGITDPAKIRNALMTEIQTVLLNLPEKYAP